MRFRTIAICLLISAFAATAQEKIPPGAVLDLEEVADSGTHGDVIMTSPWPYTETGVLLQAKPSWPYIVARTATSDTTSAFAVYNSSSNELFRVRSDGRVGIGTREPATTFHLVGTQRIDGNFNATGTVGIGTTTPDATKKLHVAGNVRVDGQVIGTYIQAHYQDVAEWVPSDEDLAPGTVVVLDAKVGNGVTASSRAYDTMVAGVVSAQPGIILGEGSASKEQVATTGRVRVKVDASRGAIAVGDLLVTSDSPGFAMRSTPIDVAGVAIHRPGTIVGKALEPLKSGEGEILVLLSLQ
jgi:hypothetical protein